MPKIHSSLMMDYATGYKLVVLNILKQHQSPYTSSITCKNRIQRSDKVFHVKKQKRLETYILCFHVVFSNTASFTLIWLGKKYAYHSSRMYTCFVTECLRCWYPRLVQKFPLFICKLLILFERGIKSQHSSSQLLFRTRFLKHIRHDKLTDLTITSRHF